MLGIAHQRPKVWALVVVCLLAVTLTSVTLKGGDDDPKPDFARIKAYGCRAQEVGTGNEERPGWRVTLWADYGPFPPDPKHREGFSWECCRRDELKTALKDCGKWMKRVKTELRKLKKEKQ